MIQRGVVVVSVVLLLNSCAGEAPDPCAAVECGSGRCALVDGAAACLCNPGFQPSGLTCQAIPAADLCASRPCAGLTNSLCLVDGSRVSCVCPESRVEVNGSCVERSPCTPNPCTRPRRTTCEVEGGAAACRCEPGYAPEGDGCSAAPVWTCLAQHADGDDAEPDECPTLAHGLSFESVEAHTIFPAGDHDWYELNVTPGRLVQFTATSTTVQLLIDVYERDGVTLLASDNRGAVDALVVFIAPPSERVRVRVRALRGSDTGSYQALYRELGVDDYVNTPAGAVTLSTASGTFSGQVQYAGDVDVVRLEVPAKTAIGLRRPDGGADLVIEVSRPDAGSRVLQVREATVISTPADESIFLLARGRTTRSLGDFALTLEDLGPDDHADEPAFATPLLADGLPVGVSFERDDDIDSFAIPQTAGRLYRVSWVATSSWLSANVLSGEGVVLAQTSSSSASGLAWKATSSKPATFRLFDGSSWGSVQPFNVSATDLGFDDHQDTLSSPTPVTAGAAVAGRLELAADIDTFSFTAVAGHVMQATATPAGTTQTSLRVRLFGPTGVMIGEADNTVGVLAATTGTYKAQVSRSSSYGPNDVQAYSFTVTDEGLDDHAGGTVGATPLTTGAPSSGSLQYAADVDAFSFTPQVDHVYAVACTRPQGSCFFRVRDPFGQSVVDTSYSSTPPSFLATSTGTWTIEVFDSSSYQSRPGPFTLTVTDRGLEDHGATFAAATPAPLGTAVTGTIGFSADVDAFSFPVVAGRIYRATISGTNAGSLRMDIRNAGNITLATSSYYGSVSLIAATSETLTVNVSASYASQALPYSITVTDAGVDDHGDTVATGTTLALDTRIAGSVQYRGDVDSFNVAVTGKRHYRVNCTGSASTGGCGIAVEAGSTLLASTYPSVNATVSFTAATGVTSVRVKITADDTATYELIVTDLGADDHGDTLADATALTLGAMPVAGQLPVSSDVDVFSLATTAGDVISLTCTTTSGTACGMNVFDSSGRQLTSVYSAAQVTTGVLSPGGTLRIELRASSYQLGSYTLSATRGSDDFTTPTPITLGTPRTGRLDYDNDTDTFTIALTAGTAVRIFLSQGVRAQVNLPSGVYATTVYGSSTSTPFTPSVTGTYSIVVSEYSSSTPIGPYTITVQ